MRAKQAVSALVAAALVVLSPGLDAVEAVAASVQARGPVSIPTLTMPAGPDLGGAASAAQLGAVPILPGSAVSGADAAAVPLTTQQSLQAEVGRLADAASDGARAAFLDSYWTGSPREAALAAEDPAAVAAAAPSVAAAAPALPRRDVAELAAIAKDAKQPAEDRLAAVKAIADLSSDPAKLALEEIGADSRGPLADYEIKRLALRRLKALGKNVSLPPLSEEAFAELLARGAKDNPEAIALDIDRTLTDKGAPITPQTAALLERAAGAGIETTLITDRPAAARRPTELGAFDAVASLTSEQRSAINLAPHRGAETYRFDAAGRPELVDKREGWTEPQRADLRAALGRVLAQDGARLSPQYAPAAVGEYDAFVHLPKRLDAAQVAEAGRRMSEELSQLGLAAHVAARRPLDESEAPYLFVSKYDKSAGVSALRRLAQRLVRLRDVERYLPAFLRPLGRALVSRLPGRSAPARSVWMIGDQFHGERTGDAGMVAGAPGGIAISVGGSADAGLDNVYVAPQTGPAATKRVLEALTAKPADGADKKALLGFFTQRTIGMMVFVPTTIVYPFIAIPAVGLAAFGVLLAFGTLAGIALGPLNGAIAKKFSSRGAILFNAGARMVLHMALPAMWYFGILANPYAAAAGLFLASVANGWLVNSIVTTDGIILRRIAGPLFGTANTLAWMNYLAVQVVMGILIGFAHYMSFFQWLGAAFGLPPVTGVGALMIPYLVSVAAHLLIIPIAAWTIPGGKPQPEAAAPGGPSSARLFLGSAAAFAARYWKEALLLSLALGAYFAPMLAGLPEVAALLQRAPAAQLVSWALSLPAPVRTAAAQLAHTMIPAALALVWWISRTADFKTLWSNRSLRTPALFASLGASLFYPLQYLLFPMLAGSIAGVEGKEQLLSQLMGALFFGQLISNGSTVKLPRVHVPLIGRFGAAFFIKAAVVLTAGVWSLLSLFPGSWPIALAVSAAAGVMIKLSGRLSDRGWVQFVGIGMSAVILPWLLPVSPTAAFVAALVFGVFYGPASVALSNRFYPAIPPGQTEQMVAVQGSLINAAITLGFGVIGLLSARFDSPMPDILLYVAAIAASIGALFYVGARRLKGLPDSVLRPKEDRP